MALRYNFIFIIFYIISYIFVKLSEDKIYYPSTYIIVFYFKIWFDSTELVI